MRGRPAFSHASDDRRFIPLEDKHPGDREFLSHHPSRIDIGTLAAIIQSAELEEDNAEDFDVDPGVFNDEDDW